MILPEFDYHRPETVKDACALLADLGEEAKVIAGGTDLLVDLKREFKSAGHLVTLRGIPELTCVEKDADGTLRLGPMVTPNEAGHSPIVRDAHAPLAEAALTMAAYQIRNRATIGGNLVSAVPSADMPPILIALGSKVALASPGGAREIPLEEFFVGPRENVLGDAEILAQIIVPPPEKGSGAHYIKHSLRDASALAVVGVAANVVLDGGTVKSARIVLGAVAPTPLIAEKAGAALTGRAPENGVIAEAATAAAGEAKPISDLRGSAEYRRELVRVLTERAVATAVERAGSSGN
jgi:carbon-monoxide dehydrogenase medium subunit